MTEKSKLGYGKFADYTVNDLLHCFGWKGKQYLRWSYFNLSNISFMDNILDELKIPEDMRIAKPGVDKEAWERLRERLARNGFEEKYGEMTEQQRMIALVGRKRRKQNGRLMVCIRKEVSEAGKHNKAGMAWKNQGHKKNE